MNIRFLPSSDMSFLISSKTSGTFYKKLRKLENYFNNIYSADDSESSQSSSVPIPSKGDEAKLPPKGT